MNHSNASAAMGYHGIMWILTWQIIDQGWKQKATRFFPDSVLVVGSYQGELFLLVSTLPRARLFGDKEWHGGGTTRGLCAVKVVKFDVTWEG